MIKKDIKIYPNGLKHIHYRIPFLQSVCLDFYVKVGSSSEHRKEQWGIAHFLEHMVFNGSSKYPTPEEQKFAATEIGADENAWTWIDMTQYRTIVRKEYIPKAFDILFDRVYKPNLNAKDVKKECGIILEERKRSDSNPGHVLDEKLDTILFDGEVYNHPVLGYADTISGISETLLKEFHTLYYSGNNSYFVTYGGVSFEEITKICQESLESLHRSDLPAFTLDTDPNPATDNETNIIMPADSSIFASRKVSTTIKDVDEYISAMIFKAILGSGQSSRLYQELVVNNSLVSSQYAYILPARSYLLWGVDCSTKEGNLSKVKDLVLKITQDVVQGNVNEKEFERARNYIIGQLTRAIESVDYPIDLSINNSVLIEFMTGVELDIIETQDLLRSVKYDDVVSRFSKLFENTKSIEGTLTPSTK